MSEPTESVAINMLPADSGDCIHIRFSSPHSCYNIVIDSGPSTCAAKFRKLLNNIRARGEAVDLLCFTHTDNDHIKGAERVFSAETFDSSHIKQVWINLPNWVSSQCAAEVFLTHRTISVNDACKLYTQILSRGIPSCTNISAGAEICLGDITIRAVLPTADRLKSYYLDWKEKETILRQENRYYLTGGIQTDSNPVNGSSISLMITTKREKLLFTGDAFPDDLTVVAQEYGGAEGFSLVKLPHHGSAANITGTMLESMNCRSFLISTKQTLTRPAQYAINLLAEYGCKHEGAVLYGNYPWPSVQKPDSGLDIIALSSGSHPVIPGNITLYTEG